MWSTSPRSGPQSDPVPRGAPRPLVAFRISAQGEVWLRDLSVELDVDKTSVIRAALAVAKTHEAELRATIRERKEQT